MEHVIVAWLEVIGFCAKLKILLLCFFIKFSRSSYLLSRSSFNQSSRNTRLEYRGDRLAISYLLTLLTEHLLINIYSRSFKSSSILPLCYNMYSASNQVTRCYPPPDSSSINILEKFQRVKLRQHHTSDRAAHMCRKTIDHLLSLWINPLPRPVNNTLSLMNFLVCTPTLKLASLSARWLIYHEHSAPWRRD